ncbi:hypothetical protein HORIV_11960 [Vreelandella olivaria]|uniref:Uncharacterized protein n=1 Tax=Vreelandella olivaria TaxID=390919 RepID=A0ABN5WPQ5_9GAMM|nr:hypothetical protein HORIV_11960 [Halomonas olivaria]
MEVCRGESDLGSDYWILPAPIPPFLSAGETRHLPWLKHILTENDWEDSLSNLVDRPYQANARAGPARFYLGHHGCIGFHDMLGIGVATNAHDEARTEQLHCSPKRALVNVDTFLGVFPI